MCTDFQNNLKYYRKKAGLRQQDMADRLCCSRQAYSNYECGRRLPAPDMIVRISDILGISTDALLRKHPRTNLSVPTRNKNDCRQ